MNIQFQRPKRGRDVGDTPSRPGKVIRSRPDSTALEETFLRELRQILLSSVVFSSLVPLSKSTPTAPVIRKLPRPLKALKNDKYTTMSHSDMNAACEDVFKCRVLSWEECVYLEECTCLQSQSQLWFEHRVGRISLLPSHVPLWTLHHPASLSSWSREVNHCAMSQLNNGELIIKMWHTLNLQIRIISVWSILPQAFTWILASLTLEPPPMGSLVVSVVAQALLKSSALQTERRKPTRCSGSPFYPQPDEEGEQHLSHSYEYYCQVQGQLSVNERITVTSCVGPQRVST